MVIKNNINSSIKYKYIINIVFILNYIHFYYKSIRNNNYKYNLYNNNNLDNLLKEAINRDNYFCTVIKYLLKKRE